MGCTNILVLSISGFFILAMVRKTYSQVPLPTASIKSLQFEQSKRIDSIPHAGFQKLKDSINVDSLNRMRDLKIIKEVIQARVNNVVGGILKAEKALWGVHYGE
jgi:hypothetical protein